jgi:hypothetical protein
MEEVDSTRVSIYSPIEQLKNKEWLKQKYVDENMTAAQIGTLLKCTKYPVLRALRKHGLGARKHTSRYPQLNNKEWLREQYVTQEKSVKQIALDIDATVGNVHSALTHMGIKTRNPKEAQKIKYREGRFGEKAAHWKGGRAKGGNGHIYIHTPAHPYANKQGYVMEHRLVKEKEIGRYLEPQEIVHHIDLNKKNNGSENLHLCKDTSDHLYVHAQLEKVATQLIQNGIIKFKDGKYYIDESLIIVSLKPVVNS